MTTGEGRCCIDENEQERPPCNPHQQDGRSAADTGTSNRLVMMLDINIDGIFQIVVEVERYATSDGFCLSRMSCQKDEDDVNRSEIFLGLFAFGNANDTALGISKQLTLRFVALLIIVLVLNIYTVRHCSQASVRRKSAALSSIHSTERQVEYRI